MVTILSCFDDCFVCLFYFHSYHIAVNIDAVVTAVLAVFTACMGVVPKFRSHGGSPRENLAMQNVQVI